MQSADASMDYWTEGLDMANGFDFANLGQMFGPGMGAMPTGLDALLTEEQRRLLGRNAALSAAAALLQAGGPSRTPINLGQALGGALQAGQAGYQQARAGALQDVMLGEKLKEAQQARELQQRLAGVFTAPTAALTPAQQALAAPVGQVGPTMQRAEAMQGMEGPTEAQVKAAQYQRAADLLAAAGKADQAKQYQDMAEKINPRDEVVGQPFEVTDSGGKPVMVQQFKSGKLQTMAGFGPKREVVLQNLGGQTIAVNKSALRGGETFQQTLTPSEAGNLAVAQGNLRVAQGNLGLRQQEFARGAYEVRDTPDGLAYVPKVPGGAAVPVTTAEGARLQGAGAKPTEDQSKSAGFAFRMTQASEIFNQPVINRAGEQVVDPQTGKPLTLEQAFGKPSRYQSIMRDVPVVGTGIANITEDPNRQLYRQAQENWVSANLRAESGAVLGPVEIDKEIIKYFPQPSDSDDVIKQKAKARRDTELAMRVRAGPAYKQVQQQASMQPETQPSPQQPTPQMQGVPVWDPVKRQFVYQ